MNILHRFTRKSLKANRSRTLVTIIGIVLSMALFTAVIEGAYSGQQYLVRTVEEADGRWLVQDSELTKEQAENLQATDGVTDSTVWQEVGWAEIGSDNEYKPYLLVESVDENIENLLAIHLISGRMPENENEILLPSHLASNGNVHYHEGDTLKLELGNRMDEDGNTLYPTVGMTMTAPEQIVNAKPHRYTVVGFYERFSHEVEDFACPGYMALTRGGGTGDYTVFCTIRHPSKLIQWLNDHPTEGFRQTHEDLRRMNASFGSDNLNTVLYGFAGVLVFLIAFGSISLIYNSFSISVSERTRQFGILKSVGATKKQIRASVRYEALVLAAIGIPIGLIVGCAGIGITLYCLRDAFAAFTLTEMATATQIKLVLHPVALLIAVAVCLVTTLISASIPARRAIRVSPIESIRQTADVKLKGKEVKTSRLTQKLFGFEGTMAAKNFKRNRKRYRSTVLSLFLSVVLFISASSFCAYLIDTVTGVTMVDSNAPDISYFTIGENREDPEKVLQLLAEQDGVTDATYMEPTGGEFQLKADQLDEGAWPHHTENEADWHKDTAAYGYLCFLRDSAFRELCKVNHVDADAYFDPEHPTALVWNRNPYMDEKGAIRYYQLLDESKLPMELCMIDGKEIDGYEFHDEVETDENGDIVLVYYPVYENGETGWDAPKTFSVEEAGTEVFYSLGEAIDTPIFGVNPNQLTLIYPYSMESAVLIEDNAIYQTHFAFMTSDHSKTRDAMKTALTDAGLDTDRLRDEAADATAIWMLVKVVNVFSYGFIILISLIAVANVFNTISTNVLLRRREFAMLRSIGLGSKGFHRMMNYECLIYGVKGLAWGLPAAIGMTYVIWRITAVTMEHSFYIPWYSIAIAVGSVFLVVFITMLYATGKLKQDNTIDALKNENI